MWDATARVLFRGKLGLRSHGRNKSKSGDDVSEEVLLRALAVTTDAEARILLGLIICHRMLNERLKKYQNFRDSLNGSTGRIHPALYPMTASGRYSTRGANVLAMASSTGIKKLIAQPDGHVITRADYNQQDFRVLADETGHLNPNSRMVAAVNSGVDLHLYTLCLLRPELRRLRMKKLRKADGVAVGYVDLDGTPHDGPEGLIEQVGVERSERAKRLNFGVTYGSGPAGIRKALNEAEKLSEVVRAIPLDAIRFIQDPDSRDELEQWLATVQRLTRRKKSALSEVFAFLEAFYEEYADIRDVRASFVADLYDKGWTHNMFGRRCPVVGMQHIRHAYLDIQVAGQFYRIRPLIAKMTRASIICAFKSIRRLDIGPFRKGARFGWRFVSRKRTSGVEIYALEPGHLQLDVLAQRVRNDGLAPVIRKLNRLHNGANLDAHQLFSKLKPATAFDLGFTSDGQGQQPVPPFVVLPQQFVRAIARPEIGFDMDYLGSSRLERQIISARIQSASMDHTKIAMTLFRKKAAEHWPDEVMRPRLCKCIHDEIAIRAIAKIAKEATGLLLWCMQDSSEYQRLAIREIHVRMEAEVGTGATYEDAKPP